ncbi:MAG: DUF2213 domain-containing protein [Gammaproteobacteria bacterium]|nr:DUF2213 domain-containing protein [Gammaproteobacteria bacterium]
MKTTLTIKNASTLTFTKEGYATGTWRFAAIGVYNYMWWELGLPYVEATNGVYRGYYPPEVYDNPETLDTFNNIPITDDHPFDEDGLINLTNWKPNAIGDTASETVFVDGGLENKFFIRDESAVGSIIAGTQDLSFGATAEIDNTRGTTPDGEDYDFSFTRVLGNHIALVKRGRMPSARILTGETDLSPSRILIGNSAGQKADGKFVITNSDGTPMELKVLSNKKDIPMTKETNVIVTIANTDLTLDADTAKEVKALFATVANTHKTELDAAAATHETAIKEVTEKLEASEAANAELVASTTPEALAAATAERVEVTNKAATLGVELKDTDTATTHDLRLQVLNATESTKDANFAEDGEAIVAKVFNSLTAPAAEKATNPLKGKTVVNAGTDDADATARAAMQAPASRAK